MEEIKYARRIRENGILKRIVDAREKVVSYADAFYFIFLCILISIKSTFIELTPYLNTFFLISAVFLGLKYLFTNWDFKDILISAVLLGAGFLTYKASGHSIMFVTVAAIVGAKDVNLKHLVKWICIFRIAEYIAIVSMYNMGLTPKIDHTSYGSQIVVDGQVQNEIIHRYNLGFTKSNPAHVIFFICTVAYIWLFFKKYNVFSAAVITLLNLFIYEQTACRTGVWMVEIIAVVALLFKSKKIFDVLKKALPYIPLFVVAFCLAMTALYGKWSVADKINDVFSDRFYHSSLFMSGGKISLFGQNSSFGGDIFDVAYINLFINYGAIFFALFMSGNVALLYDCAKNNKTELAIAVLAFVILGVTENYSLDIGMNFTLVFLSEFIFRKKSSLTGRL